jgi:hypothetical protein
MTSPQSPGAGTGPRAIVFMVEAGPASGTEISFASEFRLGRDERGGDLGGDATLSRQHAILRTGPGGITVEDLGSTNGTFVNGSRISGVRQVRPGDTVEVGHSRLRLAQAPDEGPAQRWSPAGDRLGAGRVPGADETGWVPPVAPVAPAADQWVRHPAPGARAPSPVVVSDGREPWAGTVASVERRSDQQGVGQGVVTYQVLAFRLQQFSNSGDRRGLITVEVRGDRLTGDVAAGDQVRVYGRERNGIVQAKRVDNLTTGGTVNSVGHRGRTVAQIIFAIVFIFVALLIITAIFNKGHPFGL